jgi:hypothetical protein
VGKKKIVSVNDGSAREEVKTKAAEAAVKILKENGASGTDGIMQGGFIDYVDDVMETT